jgi:hypothetical protein
MAKLIPVALATAFKIISMRRNPEVKWRRFLVCIVSAK